MAHENPDYERIWLEDRNEASEANGRQWCCDKVWPEEDGGPEPTQYVRSDIADTLRAERDALREENERLKVGGWQPIETAPKDGSSVLVFVPSARLRKDCIQVGGCSTNAMGQHLWIIGNHFGFDVGDPTHWMPLPTEPQS